MDIQETIHKLATDQDITEAELMVLLLEIVKVEVKERDHLLFHEVNYN